MTPNISSRLSTDAQYISDLIAGVKKGEIKIPQFQRKFVWDEDQAFKLLDSILNNYPIGSLLLWKTPNKLAVERNIGEFKLPKTDDLTPTDYVLDGQQRLTVIYSCFGASNDAGGFEACYDLAKEEFIRQPATYSSTVFPLRSLYATTELLNFRGGLVANPNGKTLQKRLDTLIDSVTKYKLPVVLLKDLTVEEVCPIFERINSSGTRLSTYDLMVAATWTKTFDLNAESDKIARTLKPKGFGDIDPNTVLKCLSSVHHRDVKKESVISLRKLDKTQMDSLVDKTGKSLLHVVDLLKTEFGIYSWDFLPYEAYATILAAIYSNRKTLTTPQLRRARQWFWMSAFTERYRGASEHFVSKDIAGIEAFVLSGSPLVVPFAAIPTRKSLKTTIFRSNNSKSRAFILLLSLCKPRNITNGAFIDVENALSSFNKKQFHHIYPKGYLRGNEDGLEENSIVNICMLAATENNAVSDEDPKKYIPKAAKNHGKQVRDIFASNALPDPSVFSYEKSSYSEFIEARSAEVHKKITTLCNGDAL